MTKNKGYNKMTKEQQQISNHNNELAWQWFEINLNISRYGKVLHHFCKASRTANTCHLQPCRHKPDTSHLP